MADFDKILSQLPQGSAEELLVRVQSGEATAAELTAAIKFLKDNGIDAHVTEGSPLLNLAEILPFQDPESPITSVG